jgi:hypothetical protein
MANGGRLGCAANAELGNCGEEDCGVCRSSLEPSSPLKPAVACRLSSPFMAPVDPAFDAGIESRTAYPEASLEYPIS